MPAIEPESGDGVRTRNDAATQAAKALNRLVLERIVLSYAIGYQSGRVVVTAKISAQDELSRARTKRRVQAALDLVAPGTTVAIVSVQPVEGWG
jgi:hypothetical protein